MAAVTTVRDMLYHYTFARGVARNVVALLLWFDKGTNKTGLVGRNQEPEAPYERIVITVPEDCRSMFITFSEGQPVERDDIFSYFRETWGDCIVRVLMEKTTCRVQPMYGRVIFKSKTFVSLVLNGVEHASLFIGGREIWLREYIPRSMNFGRPRASISAGS
ncbi:unnamed protein product [Miscanthus lutarioriparius]|uniref:Uncharacterized protein n=1 Tax=Miscanthus lutarioriparius TaxID=422564 RepID=A0A811Q759_9POAL|nr:unnamed protein product [Miscanthus lutarioriparius]